MEYLIFVLPAVGGLLSLFVVVRLASPKFWQDYRAALKR